jgi:branched-chain amino acid transport system substrate-binding protein
MLEAAAKKAKSNDPVKLAKALEGLKMDTPLGPAEMRADNHQFLQPLFVSTLTDHPKFDVEKSGLGFKTDEKIPAADTAMSTTCKMARPS